MSSARLIVIARNDLTGEIRLPLGDYTIYDHDERADALVRELTRDFDNDWTICLYGREGDQYYGTASETKSRRPGYESKSEKPLRDKIAELEAKLAHGMGNWRDTWEAFCAMRDTINEHIPLPSLEGDMRTEGPSDTGLYASVAKAVVEYVKKQYTFGHVIRNYIQARNAYEAATKPSGGFGSPKVLHPGDDRVLNYRRYRSLLEEALK